MREGLRKACEGLKPPYNEIALEHYYYELEVGEMAARHNKNPKTIQTQIYRARGMLRKLYSAGRPGKEPQAGIFRRGGDLNEPEG